MAYIKNTWATGDIITADKLNNLESGLGAVDTKLSQITIGGRNLLLGTADWSGGSARWDKKSTVTTDTYRGALIASTSKAWTSPEYKLQNAGILQVGKTYTFSTYIRNTSDTDTTVSYYYQSSITQPYAVPTSLPAHTDWTRIYTTFKVIGDPTTSTYPLRWQSQKDVTNGQIQFVGYKLEESNVPTDWTLAPEDVPSNDSAVVHNTGTETVAGDKTFTGNTNFAGQITLKTGNYGLRVTTAGVQKTSDNGVTWTNI